MRVELILTLTCGFLGHQVMGFAQNNSDTEDPQDLTYDLILTEEQENATRFKKAAVNARYYWPDGPDGNPLVLYVFQDASFGCVFPFIYKDINYTDCTTVVLGRPWCATKVDSSGNFIDTSGNYKYCEAVDRRDVQEGFDHWMEHTCINIQETNNTDQPHIQFIVGAGCYSYLGRIAKWNGQKLSIGQGCSYFLTIVHEIGHALGFIHEQSRIDRDKYIDVLWDNLYAPTGFIHFLDNNFSVPYDYSSVMHYVTNEFSVNNNPTMLTKDPINQEIIGVRRYLTGLSHRDKLAANRMYKCIDKWLAACYLSSDPCLNDGYTGKTCACICPPGTSGRYCGEVISDYYDHLQSTLNERISTERTISVKTPTDTSVFTKVISPPQCQKAILIFTYSYMFPHCSQRLYIRTDPLDTYGQKLCRDDVYPGLNFTSETEIIIYTYNYYSREKQTMWEADLRFESIPGCSTTITTQGPTCPPGPTCPMCSTTPAPPRPDQIKTCVTGGISHLLVLPKGQSMTLISPSYPKPYPRTRISCGWKLKAGNKGSLSITCDKFEINTKDKLRFQIPRVRFFSKKNALSSSPNIMIIKFASKRGNRGSGFKCNVVSK